MGLKDDIYKAFEKNLGKDYVDADAKGKKKIDDLATDLSKAVIDFITAQTFRVDKLSASVGPITTQAVPPSPTGPLGVPPGSPLPLPPIPIASVLTVEVDKDGQATRNPVASGQPQSNFSEVRLRPNEVKEK